MRHEAHIAPLADRLSAAFEHSITWEDDVWRADPVDVKLVLSVADEVIAAPKFADQNLDINIVRALLYMQRSDPRIDQRVRQYLYGHRLNDLSQETVAALDPNKGEGRAFEIIESLGRLMRVVDHASLVFA